MSSADENEKAAEAARAEARLKERISGIKRKLIVLSGKGGVGKSTVAANLALSLARSGLAVGLLDIDMHGPTIPVMLGLTAAALSQTEGAIIPAHVGDLKVMSLGLLLADRDQAVVWRGPLKHSAIRQLISDVAWGELDFLVIDSPPGTGDEALSAVQLLGGADGAIIVTTPQQVAVADVRRCITFCRMLSLPVVGVVENMSGFVCPHCGRRVDIFKSGGGREMAESMEVPFITSVPLDPTVVEAADEGRPLMDAARDGAAGRAFAEVAQKVKMLLDDAKASGSERTGTTMKIAVPVSGRQVSAHFGHADKFEFLEVDADRGEIIAQHGEEAPAHQPGLLPEWLKERGADVVFAGGMGQRAVNLLAEKGIRVVTGISAMSAEGAVKAYLEGSLKSGENICDH